MELGNIEDIEVSWTHDGKAVWATLNRPEKMNALSENLLEELDTILDAVDADPDVMVFVLRGAGDAFSAGYDLTEEGSDADEGQSEFEHYVEEVNTISIFRKLREIHTPTITVVDGYALDGGFELSQMADIVIASDRAEFGYNIVRGTAIPVIAFLPSLVQNNIARELVFTGRRVDSDEASEIGLANRTVPQAEIDKEAEQMVDNIMKAPSDLLYLNKRMMNHALNIMGYNEIIDHGLDMHTISHYTESSQTFVDKVQEEGLQAALKWRDETAKE